MARRPARQSTGRSRRAPRDADTHQTVPGPASLHVLEALYAALPSLECRGKCAESCVPIDMSDAERARIQRAHGIAIPPRDEVTTGSCPALAFMGTCQVYADRPMICRLWGVADAMRCPHGCRPTTGWLPDQEAFTLLLDSLDVGGSPYATVMPQLRAMIAQPALRPALGRLLRGDRTAQADIVAWAATQPPVHAQRRPAADADQNGPA